MKHLIYLLLVSGLLAVTPSTAKSSQILDGKQLQAFEVAWIFVKATNHKISTRLHLDHYTVSFSGKGPDYLISFSPKDEGKSSAMILGFDNVLNSEFSVVVNKKTMKAIHIVVGQ